MRTTLAVAAAAALAFGLAAAQRDADAPAAPAPSDAGTTVVVLQQGDWRMDAAHDCLKQMLTAEWAGGTTDFGSILEATGFTLDKITVRGVQRDSERIRFGFDFVNREQVKSLYWEADCPVDAATGTELAAREP